MFLLRGRKRNDPRRLRPVYRRSRGSPTGPRTALALLLALAPFAARSPAQERSLTIQNLAPEPRQEWFAVPVPFAEGDVHGLPQLHVENRPTVWQPYGAPWPDGSLRQAICLFRASLPASGEAELPLQEGSGPKLDRELRWNPLQFELQVAAKVGGRWQRASPKPAEILETNAARRVELRRCRVGDTGLVFELLLEQYVGQPHVAADVAVFFSDPTSKTMECRIDELAIEVQHMALLLRHPGPLAMTTDLRADGSRTVLLRGRTLGDGQGLRRTGVLVPPLSGDGSLQDHTVRAAVVAPPLGATTWSKSGAWGPFGYVPEVPPWLAGGRLRGYLARRHVDFVRAGGKTGDPLGVFRFGLAKQAGQTGDQEDFGAAKMEPVAATGIPSFLLEVELSVLQEGCRPVHFFEADGTPVLARKHPDWVVWSGRTHWHCKVSKDRLGKPCPAPRFETNGWTGKDRQHWSSLYLAGFYMLTGKYWALRELQNEVQLYLAGQTLDPELTTSFTGAPRGAGRTMLTACWLYLATGDEELLRRMTARVEKVHSRLWAGAELGDGAVRPFAVAQPDARMLNGKVPYWTPWQDALAVNGFAAFASMTGNEAARKLADLLALNLLRYGWRLEPGKPPIIATAIRWQPDGAPLDPAVIAAGDRADVMWSFGTAFSTWAIGSVEWGRQAAQRAGDAALEQRAEHLLQYLRKQRQPPKGGGFDRFGEWDAVR